MDTLVAALRKPSGADPAFPHCHTDPIELSNACRAFYQSRLQSARALKDRWGPSPGTTPPPPPLHPSSSSSSCSSSSPGRQTGNVTATGTTLQHCRKKKKKSSIDVAMETLRQEMTSLMEQDLALMKQLLTLNEEIEELKWRRRYCWPRAASSSLMTSSGDVDLGSLASFTSSEASLGWWRGESGDLLTKYPGVSSLSLHTDLNNRLSIYDEEDPMGTFNRRGTRSKGSLRTLPVVGASGGAVGHHHHHQQQQQQQQHQQQQGQHPQQVPVSSPRTVGEERERDSKSFAERESFDSGIHEVDRPVPRINSGAEMTHL
ncbi:uncharacterized protein LOC143294796 [Babylonia areolata]|uniref:uncharacterized protein LOC143294796 n=1 Tax=Babylonia areolata TaxID=304850 RepID=UPI003FD67FC4